MQDPRMLLSKESSNPKPRKKTPLSQVANMFPVQGENPREVQEALPESFKKTRKVLKSSVKNKASPSFQQPDISTSDSSRSENEYRSLRRKYLLLEEESFTLGRELREVDDVVKSLEDEKLALLDELVVLEGLIDPSELQSRGPPVL